MNLFTRIAVLSCALSLIGCSNMFESKTCGIKNSSWVQLSQVEQLDIEKVYHEKQRLADQLRVNKLLIKQQKKIAKARQANEKKQRNRLNAEVSEIKNMQTKIEADLKYKQEAYLPANAGDAS